MKTDGKFKIVGVITIYVVCTVIGWTILSLAKTPQPKKLDQLELFTQIFEIIQTSYLEKTDPEILSLGAVESMLIHVSHYCVIEPLTADTGVLFDSGPVSAGMVLGYKDPLQQIIDVIPGSAADQAGIHPGDALVGIGDKVTPNLSIDRAYRMLSGKVGDEIDVVIRRGNTEKFEEIKLKLSPFFKPEPMEFKQISGFDYLRLEGKLTRQIVSDVRTQLANHNPDKGLLLDLRDLNQGSAETGVHLADIFIADGPEIAVTYSSDKKELKRMKAADHFNLDGFPLVVLIGSRSAGPAETCAAALKTTGRAVLTGESSFGAALQISHSDISERFRIGIVSGVFGDPDGYMYGEQGVVPQRIVALPVESAEDAYIHTGIFLLTCLHGNMKVADFAD